MFHNWEHIQKMQMLAMYQMAISITKATLFCSINDVSLFGRHNLKISVQQLAQYGVL